MNQKTIEAPDTLAEECGVFEGTMKKVTFEREVEDALYAVASEVADELDWAQKDQDRLKDELDCSCEDMATAARELSNSWAAQEAATAKTRGAVREICNRRASMKRSASKLGKRGKEHTIQKERPQKHKITSSPTGKEQGQSLTNMPGLRDPGGDLCRGTEGGTRPMNSNAKPRRPKIT